MRKTILVIASVVILLVLNLIVYNEELIRKKLLLKDGFFGFFKQNSKSIQVVSSK